MLLGNHARHFVPPRGVHETLPRQSCLTWTLDRDPRQCDRLSYCSCSRGKWVLLPLLPLPPPLPSGCGDGGDDDVDDYDARVGDDGEHDEDVVVRRCYLTRPPPQSLPARGRIGGAPGQTLFVFPSPPCQRCQRKVETH